MSAEALREVTAEAQRLLTRAKAGPHAASRADDIAAAEARWKVGRARCSAATDPNACLYMVAARQVASLRRAFADVRQDDGSEISAGPLVAQCKGLDGPIGVTTVNSHPAVAILEWGRRSVVATGILEGDAVVFRANGLNGPYIFRPMGEQASLAIGGKPAMACELSAPAEFRPG